MEEGLEILPVCLWENSRRTEHTPGARSTTSLRKRLTEIGEALEKKKEKEGNNVIVRTPVEDQ